jgi:hypothetical protein
MGPDTNLGGSRAICHLLRCDRSASISLLNDHESFNMLNRRPHPSRSIRVVAALVATLVLGCDSSIEPEPFPTNPIMLNLGDTLVRETRQYVVNGSFWNIDTTPRYLTCKDTTWSSEEASHVILFSRDGYPSEWYYRLQNGDVRFLLPTSNSGGMLTLPLGGSEHTGMTYRDSLGPPSKHLYLYDLTHLGHSSYPIGDSVYATHRVGYESRDEYWEAGKLRLVDTTRGVIEYAPSLGAIVLLDWTSTDSSRYIERVIAVNRR